VSTERRYLVCLQQKQQRSARVALLRVYHQCACFVAAEAQPMRWSDQERNCWHKAFPD
jgi:hypothetical protein